MNAEYQAIILAGGGGSRLFPLNAGGMPKVLMPVANRPLLTFPLRMLEEGGVSDVLVVCQGDDAATAVRHWVSTHVTPLRIEVLKVPEGQPSVAALGQVIDRIRSESFILMSGDVVTEVPLRAQLLMHQVKGATVTALFGRRKGSPAADTQPGKAPRNVDYVGLSDGDRLVFFNHSPEPAKELHLPQAALQRHPNLAITTRLVDMQVYIFRTTDIKDVLQNRPDLLKLEDHLLPYLVAKQNITGSNDSHAKKNSLSSMGDGYRTSSGALESLITADGMSNNNISTISGRSILSGDVGARVPLRTPATAPPPPATGLYKDHQRCNTTNAIGATTTATTTATTATSAAATTTTTSTPSWVCTAYIAPEGSYCQRANTLHGYADVNRDSVTLEFAQKLLRQAPSSRNENFLAPDVTLGTKSTISSGCMVGSGSIVGDKSSVKRSVIGQDVVIGANVKVINSVVQSNVHIGDGCHIQNSIICEGCVLKANAQIKDSQLGPNFVVGAGAVLKSEALSLSSGSGGVNTLDDDSD